MRLEEVKSKHFACVYCLEFPNGKKYVGKTKDLGKRIGIYERFCGSNTLNEAISEFGLDSIDVSVIREVKCDDKIDLELCLSILEVKYIRDLNTLVPNGYNVSIGGVRAKYDYKCLCNKVLKSGRKQGQKYGHQNCKPCYANSNLKIAPIRSYLSKMRKDYDIVQYVGIAIDEPIRLARLRGTNKVSLLAKYGYTEQMAMDKCKEYKLVSPLYSMGHRGGVGSVSMPALKDTYIFARIIPNIGKL